MAASGQVGRRPAVLVWDVATMEVLAKIGPKVGEDYLERAIVATRFSPDGTKLVVVGADDHHLMGIWDWRSNQLLATACAQNGAPPQIFDIAWLPSASTTTTTFLHEFLAARPPPGAT